MPGKVINACKVYDQMDSQHIHAPDEKEARQISIISIHTKTTLWLHGYIGRYCMKIEINYVISLRMTCMDYI